MRVSSLIAAIAVATLGTVAAEAQTKYFARQAIGGLTATKAAATPKTLSCDGPANPYTLPHPTYAGGDLKMLGSPTIETARKVCNDIGAANGPAYKDYNVCYLAKNQQGANPTGYNVYMYQAGGIYEYDRSNPYYEGSITISCSYNP